MYVAEPAIHERISESAKRREENRRIKAENRCIKRQKQDESVKEKIKTLEQENHQIKFEVGKKPKLLLENKSLREELESSRENYQMLKSLREELESSRKTLKRPKQDESAEEKNQL